MKVLYCIGAICLFLFVIYTVPDHNGYHFFWEKLDKKHLPIADRDKSGEVTFFELEVLKMEWVKSHDLTLFQGELYDNTGRKLSYKEVEKLAGF